MPPPPPYHQAVLHHQPSDASSTSSGGHHQSRPLPAIPSPPPPQLPPREPAGIISAVGRQSNGGQPWTGRPAAPPPPPATNLDDECWDSGSSGGSRRHHQPQQQQQQLNELTDSMAAFRPYPQPPDVTHTNVAIRRTATAAAADRLGHYGMIGQQQQQPQASASPAIPHPMQLDDGTGTLSSLQSGRWKVSAKIQQLLNTLKRPKRRPLPEFYEDDDIELELAANPKDPNAPKPEGGPMTPALGDQLTIPSGLPRSLEAAVQRYGSSSYKAPAATVLDPNGKLITTLTYGKLQSRSYKIAYALLGGGDGMGAGLVKPGDRVALVYPNNDAIGFMCAFYGCLEAGVVPVPIEVPLTRRDAGSQQIGFLLGSCGVTVALTSDACLKGLPKSSSGSSGQGQSVGIGQDVVVFKGWPKLNWCPTDHLAKPSRDWQPPIRVQDETPAYIEVFHQI